MLSLKKIIIFKRYLFKENELTTNKLLNKLLNKGHIGIRFNVPFTWRLCILEVYFH